MAVVITISFIHDIMHKGQTRKEFIRQYSQNPEAAKTFPDIKQRYKAALKTWEQKKLSPTIVVAIDEDGEEMIFE